MKNDWATFLFIRHLTKRLKGKQENKNMANIP